MTPLRPLAELPRERVRAVFTDLDDTLTDEGVVASATYDAIWRLRDRGIPVVIVSGRPAGWADCLMRLWPLSAMIFENGAGMFVREGRGFRVTHLAQQRDPASERRRLDEIFHRLRRRIPHLKTAADQRHRLFDLAIDYREDPPYLSDDEVKLVMNELAKESDVTAKLSSIHINFWIGHHTKVTACREWIATEGKQLNIDDTSIVFSGDSPNDEPMFQFFSLSVGVANIAPYLDRLQHRPAFVTSQRAGKGFVELVDFLLGD